MADFLAAKYKNESVFRLSKYPRHESGSPIPTALSELQPELQKWAFLCMRSKNLAKNQLKTLSNC